MQHSLHRIILVICWLLKLLGEAHKCSTTTNGWQWGCKAIICIQRCLTIFILSLGQAKIYSCDEIIVSAVRWHLELSLFLSCTNNSLFYYLESTKSWIAIWSIKKRKQKAPWKIQLMSNISNKTCTINFRLIFFSSSRPQSNCGERNDSRIALFATIWSLCSCIGPPSVLFSLQNTIIFIPLWWHVLSFWMHPYFLTMPNQTSAK